MFNKNHDIASEVGSMEEMSASFAVSLDDSFLLRVHYKTAVAIPFELLVTMCSMHTTMKAFRLVIEQPLSTSL